MQRVKKYLGGVFMKTLVTGGAGFIGSHSVNALLQDGHEVAVVDHMLTGIKDRLHPDVRCYSMDILDQKLDGVFRRERPEVVLHLAAQVSVASSQKDPRFDAMNNIMGTIAVLEMCRAYQVRKIIFSSSAAVYGNPVYLPIDEQHGLDPLSFYGLSKWTAERYISKYCVEFGMEYAILRYSNVYGPGQKIDGECGVVSIFYHMMQKGKTPIIYGDGMQTRDFVYVKDVASANLAAIRSMENAIMNIATGIRISICDLYNFMCDHIANSHPPFYGKPRPGDIADSCLDVQKAERLLSWKPRYQISEGLSELCQPFAQSTG